MKRHLFSHQKPCTLKECKHIHTEQGLSYTPSQMNQLRQKGIPISNMMVSEELFFDGTLCGDMSYDPILRRDFNEIDAWELETQSKKNLMRGHKQDVETFD